MYNAVKPAYKIVVQPTIIPITDPLFEGGLLMLEGTDSVDPSKFGK